MAHSARGFIISQTRMEVGHVLDWLNEQLNNLTIDLIRSPPKRLSLMPHEDSRDSPPETGDGPHPRHSERADVWTVVLLS